MLLKTVDTSGEIIMQRTEVDEQWLVVPQETTTLSDTLAR